MEHSILKKLDIFICIFVCFAAIFLCSRTDAEDLATVKRQFSDPPRQYHSAPLWVWNDMLTDEQIIGTLRDRIDDAVSFAGMVQALESRSRRSRTVRYERLDIRRELLSFGLCRRIRAGSHAGVTGPRTCDYRAEFFGEVRREFGSCFSSYSGRLRECNRQDASRSKAR
jgi:hypothetical protein